MTKPIIALIALAVLVGLVVSGWFLTESEIVVESTAQHEFTIDERMPRVRKILVRSNAVEKNRCDGRRGIARPKMVRHGRRLRQKDF